MLAVFEPLKRPQIDRIELDRPVGTEAELAAYHASLARADAGIRPRRGGESRGSSRPRSTGLLAPAEIPKDGKPRGKRTSLPADRGQTRSGPQPSKRTPAERELVKQFAEKLEAEVARDRARGGQGRAHVPWKTKLAAIKRPGQELPRAYIWYEEGPKAPVTHVLKRGSPDQQGVAVEPGVPAVLARKAA